MPWTLYRFIFRELSRLLLLSAAVLVLLISFFLAIKPLNDGLLGPWRLITFVAYSIPTTLTIVVPFAGAFASTMVFSRMASDNEVVVCATSGISYRSILLPVFVLGWMVAIGLYLLSSWVVPFFYREISLMVQQDVPSLVISQVQKGRPVQIPGREGYVLHADDADERLLSDAVTTPDPFETVGENAVGDAMPAVASNKVIMLRGVVLGLFDEVGKMRDLFAAEKADVYMYRHQGRTFARIRLQNVMPYDPTTGNYGRVKKTQTLPLNVPNPIKDDLRFRTWNQLIDLTRHPEKYDDVARRKFRLAARLAKQRHIQDMFKGLSNVGDAEHVTLFAGSGNRYIISTPQVRRTKSGLQLTADASTPVRVQHYASGLYTREIEAQSASIQVSVDGSSARIVTELELAEVTVKDMRLDGRVTQKRSRQISRLHGARAHLQPLLDESSQTLWERARHHPDQKDVQDAATDLERMLRKLNCKISAQVHERLALSVASLMVLMLGAVLSMQFQGTTPLVVYFWSFLLALVVVFVTRSGENIASDPDYRFGLGLLVIWLGNITLFAVLMGVYLRLARN